MIATLPAFVTIQNIICYEKSLEILSLWYECHFFVATSFYFRNITEVSHIGFRKKGWGKESKICKSWFWFFRVFDCISLGFKRNCDNFILLNNATPSTPAFYSFHPHFTIKQKRHLLHILKVKTLNTFHAGFFNVMT